MTRDQGPNHDRTGPRVIPALVAGRPERLGGPRAGDLGARVVALVVLGLAACAAEVPGTVAGSPSRTGPVRQHGPRGPAGHCRAYPRRRGAVAYPQDPGRAPRRV